MDVPILHPGDIPVGGRPARAVQARTHAAAAPPQRQARVAVLLTGSSMRVMEAGLAIVAIGTAVLLGLGR